MEAGSKRWRFPCGRWLSKSEDDGATSRLLKRADKEAAAQPLLVTFKTGDRRFAGAQSLPNRNRSLGHVHRI